MPGSDLTPVDSGGVMPVPPRRPGFVASLFAGNGDGEKPAQQDYEDACEAALAARRQQRVAGLTDLAVTHTMRVVENLEDRAAETDSELKRQALADIYQRFSEDMAAATASYRRGRF